MILIFFKLSDFLLLIFLGFNSNARLLLLGMREIDIFFIWMMVPFIEFYLGMQVKSRITLVTKLLLKLAVIAQDLISSLWWSLILIFLCTFVYVSFIIPFQSLLLNFCFWCHSDLENFNLLYPLTCNSYLHDPQPQSELIFIPLYKSLILTSNMTINVEHQLPTYWFSRFEVLLICNLMSNLMLLCIEKLCSRDWHKYFHLIFPYSILLFNFLVPIRQF